ncbi:reverse transcriptase domain-containing protein [Tanacetum coccineum]|uniref:Reverse transcriptase domain-containing protein n=1 Tax=Tanacetum coccineum TaxID=301880 RepID=A0ABQ5F999_9ASTR
MLIHLHHRDLFIHHLRCIEAYLRWRSAPLSTMYPPTTYGSSAGDSYSESSAGLSRKRCKSPAATVTSSIHATRALVSFPCDLLHTSQEFRDFYFHQRIVLRRHWILIVAEIEARYKAVRLQLYKDSVRHVEEGLQDIYGHVMEIPLQRIKDIEMGQRELEALDHVASLERSNARLQGTMMMERARADSKSETYIVGIKRLLDDLRVTAAQVRVTAAKHELVMAAPIISISSDVSVKSVRSSFPQVILIGSISVEVLVAPEVGAVTVASPAGLLELDTHSSSEVDPSESSPSPVSIAPMVSPFLCSENSEPNTKIPERHISPTPHDAMLNNYSSFGHSISGHSLSGHTPPDTTDADSSTPLRFVHPSLARNPRCSEAYLRWMSAPLSTMYPPTTSESSARDSSSESSVGPSRKRCRSPAATMSLSIHTTRALVPSRADLLPPLDRDVEARVDASIDMEVDVGDDVENVVEGEVESSDRGTIEVGVDVVVGVDIPDGMLMPDVVEHLEQNGSDDDNGNGRDGKGGDGDGRDENPNKNNRDDRPVTRECTYQDFMKCQPLNFKGTEGVVGLIRWFEKMETVFHISNCPKKYQVKYATCTLLNIALTWWNSHKRTIGAETAFAMSWRVLMKLMAEEDRVDKLIGGLPDNIQGNVIATEPTRLQDVVRIANNLMDQKLKGYAVKNAKNKRRLEVNQRDNHGQQPPFKRLNVGGQNVAGAYTVGNNERKPYNGPLPLYNKCKLHHEGPCTVRCGKCNKVGHLTQDCKCGRQGHYRSDCPKLKDQNHGNKAGNKNYVGEARGKAYVLGGGDANTDSIVAKDKFLLNNHYASMIFDSGTDRSFVSTTFSTLLDI